jgi:hypothetical protein
MLERMLLNRDRSLLISVAAWCLAGAIALGALARVFAGSEAFPLHWSSHWTWFLALGILAGLNSPAQWSREAWAILALAVLDAVAEVPAAGPASGVVTAFTGALAGLAGMHAGRAIALLIARFGSGPRRPGLQQGKAGAS